MPSRVRAVDDAARRAKRQLDEVLADIREARIAGGLSQAAVGRSIGLSPNTISRIERGVTPIELVPLAMLARAVGLDLSLRSFAAGPPIRDIVQARLLERFFVRIGPGWPPSLEVAVGDGSRAFDAVIRRGTAAAAIEAVTRLRDGQAQIRPILRKQVDSGIGVVILLLSETQTNRRALEALGPTLAHDFPAGPREVLAALDRGELPATNGIVRM